MTIEECKAMIRQRMDEIQATPPTDDDGALYLQGCYEELKRLLDRLG